MPFGIGFVIVLSVQHADPQLRGSLYADRRDKANVSTFV
jgi:hypothetical protein